MNPTRREALAALPLLAARPKPFRLYAVGNSVTDALNYKAFAGLLRAGGFDPTVARQMIPGAPLEWLWDHPADGFKEEPFGYPTAAFANHRWDAISLQPFDRKLASDVKHITAYIDLARKNPANADTTFAVYARWPRMSKSGKGVPFDRTNFGKPTADPAKITDYSQLDPWQTLWDRKYTGGWDGSEESRDYFETLTREVRKERPAATVVMIPVGHVMAALDRKLAAGAVPGFTSIWDVYSDGIHLLPAGCFVVGVTFVATLTGAKPDGLPAADYGDIPAAFADLARRTVAEVVAATELSRRP